MSGASLLKLPGKAVSVRFRLRTVLEGWQLQASAVGPCPKLIPPPVPSQPPPWVLHLTPCSLGPSPFLHFPLNRSRSAEWSLTPLGGFLAAQASPWTHVSSDLQVQMVVPSRMTSVACQVLSLSSQLAGRWSGRKGGWRGRGAGAPHHDLA